MISNRQLCFGIASYLVSTSLFTTFVRQLAQQNAWIIVLYAGAFSFFMVWLYTSLTARFPGQGLMKIHANVYGKYIGFFVNIAYIVFFMVIAVTMLRNVGSFFVTHIMPETPMPVIMLLVLIPCIFAVTMGIENLLRCAFLFFVLAASITLTNFTLLISEMEFSNFFPLLNMGFKTYLEGTASLSAIPFCEIIVFITLFPISEKNRGTRQAMFLGLALGILMMFISFIQDIAVLGIAVDFLSMPSYESVRIINVMNVFTRLEILYAFLISVLHIFKLSLLYYCIIQSFQDVFPIPKKLPLLIFVGGTMVIAAIAAFRSNVLLQQWWRNTGIFFFSAFEFVLPAITLLIAIFRKFRVPKDNPS